jgi:myo-inositol 2-dehydrogenase/D-chiro-inositol 1-dehydrogenase
MRVGLIGCGRIAERGYVPAFARAEGVQLAAVVDVQSERCRAVAPGVAAFANVAELVASGEVDAVIVATPVGAHVEVAAEAAEAGLATLVEKPPARTASEAVGLLELEPAAFVAFNRRFEPGLLSIREQIPPGPIELRLRFHRRGAWGSHGGDDDPLLLDVGPHALDLVRWLAGAELTRIRARELADGASIDVELADGHGTASVEIRTNSPFLESVEVHTDGRRVAQQRTGGALAGALARITPGTQSPLVASLASQLESFAGDGHGLASAADGVAVMAAVDAARTSAATASEWQPIPTVDECSRSFSSTR